MKEKHRSGVYPGRDDRPIYRFYFEGLTEYYYFNGFKKDLRGAGVYLKMKKPTTGRSKSTLVKEAIKDMDYDGSRSGDRAFVIFDIDEPYDQADLTKASEEAEKNNMELFVSNDAFELWPLLHFKDVKSQMMHKELEKELKREMKNKLGMEYKKPCKDLYATLSGHPGLVEQAIARARKLPPKQNPSTDVYKLVEILQSLKE